MVAVMTFMRMSMTAQANIGGSFDCGHFQVIVAKIEQQ